MGKSKASIRCETEAKLFRGEMPCILGRKPNCLEVFVSAVLVFLFLFIQTRPEKDNRFSEGEGRKESC